MPHLVQICVQALWMLPQSVWVNMSFDHVGWEGLSWCPPSPLVLLQHFLTPEGRDLIGTTHLRQCSKVSHCIMSDFGSPCLFPSAPEEASLIMAKQGADLLSVAECLVWGSWLPKQQCWLWIPFHGVGLNVSDICRLLSQALCYYYPSVSCRQGTIVDQRVCGWVGVLYFSFRSMRSTFLYQKH